MIMMFLCLAGAILNIVINLLNIYAGIPLYMDTILTITITLTCGFFWGASCGALTNIIGHSFIGGGWEGYLFVICNIATAFVTWLFMRLFPQELNLSAGNLNAKGVSNEPHYLQRAKPHQADIYRSSLFSMIMDRVIVLIIFSFALCFAMSFLGGLIAAAILALTSSVSGESRFTALFSASMFKGNTPVFVAEIVSRIPVNTIERLISAFSGYGIALALRRLLNFFLNPRVFKSPQH